jgi:flagellar FliL protein
VPLPEIRNGILLILTSKKVDELGKVEGKNQLRVDIRDAVNKPINLYKAPPESADSLKWKPKKGAVDVLLTSFVIQ